MYNILRKGEACVKAVCQARRFPLVSNISFFVCNLQNDKNFQKVFIFFPLICGGLQNLRSAAFNCPFFAFFRRFFLRTRTHNARAYALREEVCCCSCPKSALTAPFFTFTYRGQVTIIDMYGNIWCALRTKRSVNYGNQCERKDKFYR